VQINEDVTVPNQLLAKNFLDYVGNVVEEMDEEPNDRIDDEYLDLILSDEIKMKVTMT
jgi:hypothetical protein